MRKIIILIIIGLILFITMSIILSSGKIKYVIGKDTVARVGDAKYQVLKFNKQLGLITHKSYDESRYLIEDILNYKVINDTLYVVSKSHYAIAYGKDNICKIYPAITNLKIDFSGLIYLDSYDDFDEKEKKILESLK